MKRPTINNIIGFILGFNLVWLFTENANIQNMARLVIQSVAVLIVCLLPFFTNDDEC